MIGGNNLSLSFIPLQTIPWYVDVESDFYSLHVLYSLFKYGTCIV